MVNTIEYFKPIDLGHLNIEENQVRLERINISYCTYPVFALSDDLYFFLLT